MRAIARRTGTRRCICAYNVEPGVQLQLWRQAVASKETPDSSSPVRAGLLDLSGEVASRPRPGELSDPAACGSSLQVSLLKVDAPVTPGEASLVRGVAEGRPAKRQVTGRHRSSFELRAACSKGNRRAEAVAPRKESQDLRAGCAERAVT